MWNHVKNYIVNFTVGNGCVLHNIIYVQFPIRKFT